MLKVIYRILIILVVVALVGGAIFALVQNKSGGIALGGRAFTRQSAATNGSGTFSGQSFTPNRVGERGEGRFSFSPLRGLSGIVGNSLLILVMTLGVFQLRKAMAPRILRVRPISLDQP